jgi:Uma2 family endonuclease
MMAPPSSVHQEILAELTRQIGNFLEGKRCKVYPAPFGVRLFEQDGETPEDVDTMVEPDISVVCDRNKIDKKKIFFYFIVHLTGSGSGDDLLKNLLKS